MLQRMVNEQTRKGRVFDDMQASNSLDSSGEKTPSTGRNRTMELNTESEMEWAGNRDDEEEEEEEEEHLSASTGEGSGSEVELPSFHSECSTTVRSFGHGGGFKSTTGKKPSFGGQQLPSRSSTIRRGMNIPSSHE
jgi:hypothetical protein